MTDIFISLVNMSIMASWLILAVIALRVLLKKAPKSIRCALWALVGIRLVCPFSFESVLSLIPSPQTVSHDIAYSPSPAIESGIPAVNGAVNTVIAKTLTPTVGASVNPMQVLLFAAAVLWVAGLAAMLIYALVSYLRLRKEVGASVTLDSNILLCDEVKSPFILGIFKPKIYLPSGMTQEQVISVVAHENAHLRRHDHWFKPLGFLLLSVYWFNPLCWVAYWLLCKDIELACDERVIKDMDIDSKKSYSEALLACSVDRRSFAACPLAFGEVGVRERVKGVLNYKKPAFLIIVVAVIACAATAVCLMTSPKRAENLSLTQSVVAKEPTCELDYISVEVEKLDYSNGELIITLKFSGKDSYINDKTKQVYISENFFCYKLNNGAEDQLKAAAKQREISAAPVLLGHGEGLSISVSYRVTDRYEINSSGTYCLEPIITTNENPAASYSAYVNFELISKETYPGLDAAVSAAILSENAGNYYDGECTAQGHIILGTKQSGNKTIAYCLTRYDQLGFENDRFVPVAGNSVPAVFTFETSGVKFSLKKAEYARDGRDYEASIRRMFPDEYADRALRPTDDDKSAMAAQITAYAETYLTRIGRGAEIRLTTQGYILLSNLGVSNEVSNKLDETLRKAGATSEYPSWVGTREQLENGVRFVYETSYENSADLINYKKYEYGSGVTVEEIFINAHTGEIVSVKPAPGTLSPASPEIVTSALDNSGKPQPSTRAEFFGEIHVQKSSTQKAVKLTDEAFKSKNGFDVYSYGVDSVEIKIDGEYVDAATALNSGRITPKKLVSLAKADAKKTGQYKDSGSEIFVSYDDGGSVLYPAGSYALLKMNKISGVDGDYIKDIYIGTPELDINEIT